MFYFTSLHLSWGEKELLMTGWQQLPRTKARGLHLKRRHTSSVLVQTGENSRHLMIWLRALSLVPNPHGHVSLSLLYFLVQEPMFQKALLWEPDVPGQGQGWS